MTNPIGWNPYVDDGVPPGLAALAGGPFTTVADPDMIASTSICPGGGGKHLDVSFSMSYTSTAATTLAATLAGMGAQFVTMALLWQPGETRGYLNCPGTTTVPPSRTITITMSGTIHCSPPLPSDTPIVGDNDPLSNVLIQAAAPSWAGQDPDNSFNRAFWVPADVGSISYTYAGNGATAEMLAPRIQMVGFTLATAPAACPVPAVVPTIAASDGVTGIIRLG